MNKKQHGLIITIILIIIIIVGGNFFYNRYKDDVNTNQPSDNEVITIPAIDFNVQNDEGKNTYLSDFKDGKPIVLNFWASECPPCRLEMPDFQELYNDYKEEVHFIFIDSIGALGETKESGKAFIVENKYTFPVYYDVNQNAQSAYSVYSFPTTYLIDQNFEVIRGGSGMINYDILAEALDEVLDK